MKSNDIHATFHNTLEDTSTSYSNVADWINKFKFELESLENGSFNR